jgi:hypothetical protein
MAFYTLYRYDIRERSLPSILSVMRCRPSQFVRPIVTKLTYDHPIRTVQQYPPSHQPVKVGFLVGDRVGHQDRAEDCFESDVLIQSQGAIAEEFRTPDEA